LFEYKKIIGQRMKKKQKKKKEIIFKKLTNIDDKIIEIKTKLNSPLFMTFILNKYQLTTTKSEKSRELKLKTIKCDEYFLIQDLNSSLYLKNENGIVYFETKDIDYQIEPFLWSISSISEFFYVITNL
jgi:hypothetical protein